MNKFLIILIVAASLYGCYPGGPQVNEDFDLVASIVDQEFDFNTVSTYVMPDSIVQIDDPEDPNTIPIDFSQKDLILAQIDQNLQARGFVKLPANTPAESADLVVLPAASATTQQGNYLIWWDNWGWYGGWQFYPYPYGSSWLYFFPWAPSLYDYNVGALIVTIVHPDSSNPAGTSEEETIPAVWLGAVNGLLTGESNAERTTFLIDQMFAITPIQNN